MRFVQELGQRLGRVTGEVRSTNFLIQRLSVAVQRGNSASVLGTMDVSESFAILSIYVFLLVSSYIVMYCIVFVVFLFCLVVHSFFAACVCKYYYV